MILHSKLAAHLRQRQGEELNKNRILEILQLTSEGVHPEGAQLMEQEAGESASPATDSRIESASIMRPNYALGKASLKELEGVDSRLVACVKLAITLTTQDFTVFDGLRTFKEQQLHVANGTSRTMSSKHLEGLAVDLVPYINGKLDWDWEGCYKIAMAMDTAATRLGCADKITWGGAWDRRLSDFGSEQSWEAYRRETQLYNQRTGKSFVDGPHFEIRKL